MGGYVLPAARVLVKDREICGAETWTTFSGRIVCDRVPGHSPDQRHGDSWHGEEWD